jgi:hypothetical protein
MWRRWQVMEEIPEGYEEPHTPFAPASATFPRLGYHELESTWTEMHSRGMLYLRMDTTKWDGTDECYLLVWLVP